MKKMMLLFGLIASGSGAALANTAAPEAEKIFGQSPDHNGLTFQVYSGGCTDKSSFTVRILESEPVQLELVRIRPDYCRAWIPYGVKVRYSWDDLGLSQGARYVVKNERRVVSVR